MVNQSEMVILGYKSVDPSVMKVSSYSIIFLSKSGANHMFWWCQSIYYIWGTLRECLIRLL